ncbi:hypothetical protein LCGC14_1860860 [marine sediment metagenome]|uniref:Uncharacterized protein n=1 Tax=marine sediment metagenome TaxID=412755 RepID=A0A0F9GW01_9ZZZZ
MKKKLDRSGARTGGSNRRKEFYKKVAPWCKKNLNSGHPWDGSKVYMDGFGGLDQEKKPLICDTCGERTFKTKGEFYDDKLINRCEDCIHLGIFKIIKNNEETKEKKET